MIMDLVGHATLPVDGALDPQRAALPSLMRIKSQLPTISTSYPKYDQDFDKNGETKLYISSGNDCKSHVKQYLEKGANPALADRNGRTPLEAAARNGHIALVLLFLTMGCNPDGTDKWGQTPLWWAACNGHEVVVKELLNWGANPKSMRPKGELAVTDRPRQKNLRPVVQILETWMATH